jgi:hypothetical protein
VLRWRREAQLKAERVRHEVCQLAAKIRYWLAESYEARHAAGLEPQSVDKEFLRLWFRANCDPYADLVRLCDEQYFFTLPDSPVHDCPRGWWTAGV